MANSTTKLADIKPAVTDQSEYLVHSRQEIAAILCSLCRIGHAITVYFDDGRDFILTSLVEVRAEQDEVIADFSADAAANRRALKAGKVTFVAVLDRIQIRFFIDALGKTSFKGHDVFSMPLPTTMLRLQRRETFRVSVPLAQRLKCIIGSDRAPIEVTIVDISCGGMAIDASFPNDISLGMYFRGCRILLPGGSDVMTDVLIRTTAEITLKNGARHLRAGCEFIDMSGRDQARIQRHVSKLERERMNRSAGK